MWNVQPSLDNQRHGGVYLLSGCDGRGSKGRPLMLTNCQPKGRYKERKLLYLSTLVLTERAEESSRMPKTKKQNPYYSVLDQTEPLARMQLYGSPTGAARLTSNSPRTCYTRTHDLPNRAKTCVDPRGSKPHPGERTPNATRVRTG